MWIHELAIIREEESLKNHAGDIIKVGVPLDPVVGMSIVVHIVSN